MLDARPLLRGILSHRFYAVAIPFIAIGVPVIFVTLALGVFSVSIVVFAACSLLALATWIVSRNTLDATAFPIFARMPQGNHPQLKRIANDTFEDGKTRRVGRGSRTPSLSRNRT